MQTELTPEFASSTDGRAAEAILRKCVHCGFCNATCPTYQILGDELDGPRGRIYLIKQALEGGEVTRSTQLHLDRCLTCRNCETTCPSGVEYGQLLEIGRRLVDKRVQRPRTERAKRWLLRAGLTSALFAPALRLGQRLRPLLPKRLRRHMPTTHSASPARAVTPQSHPRKVLLLAGCVQPALLPRINPATVRVMDAAGIECVMAPRSGCCGAIRSHLSDEAGGLDDMRRNIDAWWPLINSGAVEAIVINASACALTVKDYGHALAHDADYAAKAARISAAARDVSEYLPHLVSALRDRIHNNPGGTTQQRSLAFHPPCTLQHGQRLRGGVETALQALGFDVRVAAEESHLCCGSAGTYAVLQPTLATQLRDRKLQHLGALEPDCIISANVGCITHLQSGTALPVKHWIEVLDDALADKPALRA